MLLLTDLSFLSLQDLMLYQSQKHGPQEEHTRGARVGSLNPEKVLGKRRDRPRDT